MSEEEQCYSISYLTNNDRRINELLADFKGTRQRIVFYEDKTYEMIACTKEYRTQLGDKVAECQVEFRLLGALPAKDRKLELDKRGVWLFFTAIDIFNPDAVHRLMQEGYTSVGLLNKYPPTREDYAKLGFCMFHKNKLYTIVRERHVFDDDVQYMMQ